MKHKSVECQVSSVGKTRSADCGTRNTDHASRITHHVLRSTLHAPRSTLSRRAFTLIELMVVVAIMAVVMAIGIPSFRKIWEKGTMQRTLTDIQEVCSHARSDAILKGVTTEVVFHPKEGRVEIVGGAAPQPQNGPEGQPNPYSVFDNGMEVRSDDTMAGGGSGSGGGGSAAAGSGRSAEIPLDRITIQMLDINLIERKDDEIARVHFYPNGTSDEMTLIMHSDEGVQRGISLEVTTGLASILFENDLQRLVNGRL